MEQLNRIELIGRIGSVNVQQYGNHKVAKLSVATNYVYKGKGGDPVIETTWHPVTAWAGKGIADFDTLEKGKTVHVIARLRSMRYTDAQGKEINYYEELAHTLEVVDDAEKFEQ